MLPRDWMTNNPEAAKHLRKADKAFEAAIAIAKPLPLQEKVEAFRAAKKILFEAYGEAIAKYAGKTIANPSEQSEPYRSAMKDAGRGHLLK